MSEVFQCPSCGAPLDYSSSDKASVSCPFCRSTVIVPGELRKDAPRKIPIPKSFSVQIEEIRRLHASGNKIGAIKIYRDAFGSGLKEAKDAVEELDQGGVLPLPGSILDGYDPDLNRYTLQTVEIYSGGDYSAAIAEITALAEQRKKIEAIKRYREVFGGSLQDAEAVVSRLMAGEPVMFGQAGQTRPKTRANGYSALIFIIGLIVLIGIITAAVGLMVGKAIESTTDTITRSLSAQTTVEVFSNRDTGSLPALATGQAMLESISTPSPTPAAAEVVLEFGEKGIGAGKFTDARSIAVDPDGKIYVAEYIGGDVSVFEPDGRFISRWNTGDRELPLRGFDVDREGRLYIAQRGMLRRFDAATGELIDEIKDAPDFVDDVAVFLDGGFLTTGSQDQLVRFDAQGKRVFALENAVGEVTGNRELSIRLAVDGKGGFYLLAGFNNVVLQFSPEGKFRNRFGSRGNEAGQFSALQDLAVDSQGRIYVADSNGVLIFAPDGRFLEMIDPPSGVVFGMTINADDEIFLVTNAQKVYKMKLVNNP